MIIRLGDHSTVHAFRAGLVVLHTSSGPLYLDSVHVPEFRMSLLSVGQLSFKGWHINFNLNICKIINPQGELRATATAKASDDLFVLSLVSNALVNTRSGGGVDVPSVVNVDLVDLVDSIDSVDLTDSVNSVDLVDLTNSVDHVDPIDSVDHVDPINSVDPVDPVNSVDSVDLDNSDPVEPINILKHIPSDTVQHDKTDNIIQNRQHPSSFTIWHRRFAHLHPAALRKAIKSTSRILSNETDLSPCEVCIRSKHQQQFNRNSVPRSKKPFELIHSDLCGPFSTVSLGGASYYIVYIDDCTRWTEVFLLIGKGGNEIRSKFLHYKAWVENQGYKIKRFRCDNGRGEFNNAGFFEILSENGITYEPAPPYTQHKNGTSERMIRTINTKARSMLLDAKLPAKFWGEAIQTASYLHKRTPTATLPGFISPFEHLYGTTPKIHHLRRFGCAVYKHIPKDQRSDKNLGNRSRLCMMLGYVHQTTKIWRIWDFTTNRAIECSNALFNEELNANTKEFMETELSKLFPDIDKSTYKNSLPGVRAKNLARA